MIRLKHVQAGGRGQLRRNTTPHEQLALILARFGDWTAQPDLAESRAEDVLHAIGARLSANTVYDRSACSVEQVRRNYEVLVCPCARLCAGDVAREVSLLDDDTVGRIVRLFVPKSDQSF